VRGRVFRTKGLKKEAKEFENMKERDH